MGELVSDAHAAGLGLRPGRHPIARFPRIRRAVLAVAASLALALFVLFLRPLTFLPDYPAVLAAFLVWAIAPGWLLQRALLNDRSAALLERLAVAFLASMALAALPGLAALRLHWSIDAFAVVYALFAAVASGLALLVPRDDEEALEDEAPRDTVATAPLLIVLGLALVAILVLPLWAEGRVSRDFGDFEYMRYVNRYATTGTLDPSDPVLCGSTGGFGRLGVNVWMAEQALLADNAGVSSYGLLMDLLPPIMTVLAIAALFTLARGLFRNRRVASLAAVVALGYGAIDLSSYESFGRNLFLRSDQDKVVVSLVLVPLGLLFVCRFLTRPTARTYAACLLAAGALFVVHPMGVEFLGLALISVAVLRAIVERSATPLRSAGLVLLPWAIPLLAALVWSVKLGEPGLKAFGETAELETYSAIVRLGHGLIMGNYHLILHPLMLAAVLLAPIVWLRAPRSIGTQTLAAVTASALALLLAPVLATPLSKVVSEQGVFRLPWLIPVPLTIAYVCEQALTRFLPAKSETSVTPLARMAPLAGIGAVVVVLGGAFVVQEQYARVDNGDYYIRTSSADVLPGTRGSIAWGGIEYAFAAGWRPSVQLFRLADALRELPANATVTVPPGEAFLLPAVLDSNVHVVGYLAGTRFAEQDRAAAMFYGGQIGGTLPTTFLHSNGIDYVVVVRGTPAATALGIFAQYPATEFQPREGFPRFVTQPAYSAWAFAPDVAQGIGGALVTVPQDIDPEHAALTFDLGLAPAQPAATDQQVRMAVSVYRADGSGAPIVNDVVDVTLPAGQLYVSDRRTLDLPLGPGASYAVSIARLGDSQADTYPADLLFSGLTMSYSSTNLHGILGTRYDVHQLPRAGR